MTIDYTSGEDRARDELTDDELDALLAEADSELLEYIKDKADPEAGLLAIMAAADETPLRDNTAAALPFPQDQSGGHAAAIIGMRSIARALREQITDGDLHVQACLTVLDPAHEISQYMRDATSSRRRALHTLDEAQQRAAEAHAELNSLRAEHPRRRLLIRNAAWLIGALDVLACSWTAAWSGGGSLVATLFAAVALLSLITSVQAVIGWPAADHRTRLRIVAAGFVIYGICAGISILVAPVPAGSLKAGFLATIPLCLAVIAGGLVWRRTETVEIRRAFRQARRAARAVSAAREAVERSASEDEVKRKRGIRPTAETLGADGVAWLHRRVSVAARDLADRLEEFIERGPGPSLAQASSRARELAAWAAGAGLEAVRSNSADMAAFLDACDIEDLDRTVWSLPAAVKRFLRLAMPGFDALPAPAVLAQIEALRARAQAAIGMAQMTSARLAAALQMCPAQLLAGIEVDASGADLSNTDMPDLEVLEGVIWTEDTSWPPDLDRDCVRAVSIEISPGVFKVRNGNERDHIGLVRV